MGMHYRHHHHTMDVVWEADPACVWLGGWGCGNDWNLLAKHNIKLVVNCTGNVESHQDLGRRDGTRLVKCMVTRGPGCTSAVEFFQGPFQAVERALAHGDGWGWGGRSAPRPKQRGEAWS